MKIEKTWMWISLVGCLTIFLGPKYLLGWLLGCFVSRICLETTKNFAKRSLENGISSGANAHFGVNYLLMAVAMLFSVVFPMVSNIFTCFAGLLSVKISIYLSEVI
ncbi:hypothetical protein [Bulleidia sp. zg-1006]|uniref:hypothetical protein n=1 Tax=Bulleidia sp. zg-1006 TaxID=2806552 RepID=UPI00193A16F7|nr:hypothetical protein [Bulleidia sp. zg-1006]QRG86759.1 hypothetical protein JOS54_00105 [Bulleidia sp. zg-1006]